MSLSRRQFGKAALTSAAHPTTGVVFPQAAYAADTACVSAHFIESFNQQRAADYGPHLAVNPINTSFRVTS